MIARADAAAQLGQDTAGGAQSQGMVLGVRSPLGLAQPDAITTHQVELRGIDIKHIDRLRVAQEVEKRVVLHVVAQAEVAQAREIVAGVDRVAEIDARIIIPRRGEEIGGGIAGAFPLDRKAGRAGEPALVLGQLQGEGWIREILAGKFCEAGRGDGAECESGTVISSRMKM